MQNAEIWYKTPCNQWLDGLPLGNGRLAAMVWGGDSDIISLNHEKLWRGLWRDRENYPVPNGILKYVRTLVDNKDYFTATALANACFGGRGGTSGIPERIDSYQPAGDIVFTPNGENKFIKRKLNLEDGICTVQRGNTTLTAFTDVSEKNGGPIVLKWEGDNINGVLSFKRAKDDDAKEQINWTKQQINYSCSFKGGLSFFVVVYFESDGTVTAKNKAVNIENATYLTAWADISVEKPITLTPKSYSFTKEKHTEIFSNKMNEFYINIDTKPSNLPTDLRVMAMRKGKNDDGIIMLFYKMGRYLLVSSNICGELPANLQGKWNDDINAPWSSDYHLNINLQMNYWAAEPTGLGQYANNLINLIEKFVPHGKQTAKELYGCRGVFLPHATDCWGRATPESYGWAVWICAAPWIGQHYFDRYLYSGDKNYLKNTCYPFLKEVAQFYEDYLTKDSDGVYQIVPSQSPENRFSGTGVFPVSIGKSSAMDVQVAFMALDNAIECAEILGVDKESVAKWKEMKENLPPFKIGTDGRLLEWNEEMEEVEPGHRHFSHLFGVYPGKIFTDETYPDQFLAAKKSLEYRLLNGGGQTGWSRAWLSCIYARFGDGEKLYENISCMVKEFSTISLLDTHPRPGNSKIANPQLFQIDGNFGAVAGITEGLAQIRDGKLHLLYALPKHWEKGQIHGFKTPGGHTVDFKWEKGKVTDVTVTLGFGENLIIVYNGEQHEIK